jgi:hypothetical protein
MLLDPLKRFCCFLFVVVLLMEKCDALVIAVLFIALSKALKLIPIATPIGMCFGITGIIFAAKANRSGWS